jgi:vancomycin resistance protein YoaR
VITNDWDAAALVRVVNSSDSITVSLYSTSFGRRVEESTSDPFDFTEPQTRYVATEGIPAGQEQEITSGDKGYSVTITRKVYKGAELLSDDSFTTVYLAPPKVIGVAPGTPGAETPSAPSG